MGPKLLLCILAAAIAAFAQTDSWESAVAAAYRAYESGRLREAENYFSAALEQARKLPPQDPRFATSLNNLAALYDSWAATKRRSLCTCRHSV